jgi:hypothetical protein
MNALYITVFGGIAIVISAITLVLYSDTGSQRSADIRIIDDPSIVPAIYSDSTYSSETAVNRGNFDFSFLERESNGAQTQQVPRFTVTPVQKIIPIQTQSTPITVQNDSDVMDIVPHAGPEISDDAITDTTLEPLATADIEVYREFGNTVAQKIQTFSLLQSNQYEVMGDFASGTTDTSDVLKLSAAYSELAKDLTTVTPPKAFVTAFSGIVDGYATVGSATKDFSESTPSQKSMEAYNAHIETFARAFTRFSLLFGALGVTFTSDEPGYMFSPPSSM